MPKARTATEGAQAWLRALDGPVCAHGGGLESVRRHSASMLLAECCLLLAGGCLLVAACWWLLAACCVLLGFQRHARAQACVSRAHGCPGLWGSCRTIVGRPPRPCVHRHSPWALRRLLLRAFGCSALIALVPPSVSPRDESLRPATKQGPCATKQLATKQLVASSEQHSCQNAIIRVILSATLRSLRTPVSVFCRSVYTRNTSLSGAYRQATRALVT